VLKKEGFHNPQSCQKAPAGNSPKEGVAAETRERKLSGKSGLRKENPAERLVFLFVSFAAVRGIRFHSLSTQEVPDDREMA